MEIDARLVIVSHCVTGNGVIMRVAQVDAGQIVLIADVFQYLDGIRLRKENTHPVIVHACVIGDEIGGGLGELYPVSFIPVACIIINQVGARREMDVDSQTIFETPVIRQCISISIYIDTHLSILFTCVVDDEIVSGTRETDTIIVSAARVGTDDVILGQMQVYSGI